MTHAPARIIIKKHIHEEHATSATDVGIPLDDKRGDTGQEVGGIFLPSLDLRAQAQALSCILRFIHNHKIYREAGHKVVIF